jgi:quinol monooxygenase YgiN
MTIRIVATIKVAEGKNDAFEKMTKALAKTVTENEEGVNFYTINKSLTDPQTYVFMEEYVSHEALDAHGKTDYFVAFSKDVAALVQGPPKIELLQGLE